MCQSGTTAYKNAVNIWSTARYQYIITFAGCSTAGGNNKDGTVNSNDTNITKRAVEQGASVAVGWTTSVSAGSHTNWLKRYNDALANGSSVAQAISKANSYIYLPGSGVKNVVYYGNGNIKLKSIATKSAYVDDYSELSNLNLPEREKLEDLKVAAISNMTTLNDNNDIVSYVYESTDERIVDIYYKYNGIISNSGLTMKLDADDNIIGYTTHNISEKELFNESMSLKGMKTKKASDSLKKLESSNAIDSISKSDKLINQTQFEYYDIQEQQTVLVTYTEVENEFGAKFVHENITPIN